MSSAYEFSTCTLHISLIYIPHPTPTPYIFPHHDLPISPHAPPPLVWEWCRVVWSVPVWLTPSMDTPRGTHVAILCAYMCLMMFLYLFKKLT